MRTAIALLFSLCLAVPTPKYRPFMFYNTYVRVGDGIRFIRNFNCNPSFEYAHLIVIDNSCGQRQGKCKRYCTDRDFTDLYCDYKCHAMSPQMAAFLCNEDFFAFRYHGTESPTAKPLGEWSWQASGMREMRGNIWSEQVGLEAFPVVRREITQIDIVSAVSFDSRVLGGTHGVIGLAPGTDNPLYQMAKARALQPIVTISHNFWSYRNQQRRRVITVGSIDKARCSHWEFVKSLSPHRWVFEISDMDFMGVQMGKSVGMFSYGLSSFASVGIPIMDRLKAEGVAKFLANNPFVKFDHFIATVPCDYGKKRLPPSRLKIGDIWLSFNESATFGGFMYADAKEVGCSLSMIVDHKSPHQNANVWIFGFSLFREYCVAFDYEKLQIGFARLRKAPFPYVQQGYPVF